MLGIEIALVIVAILGGVAMVILACGWTAGRMKDGES